MRFLTLFLLLALAAVANADLVAECTATFDQEQQLNLLQQALVREERLSSILSVLIWVLLSTTVGLFLMGMVRNSTPEPTGASNE